MRNLIVASALALAAAFPAAATVFSFSVVSVAQTRGDDTVYVPNFQFRIDDASAAFIDQGYYTEIDNVVTNSQRPYLGSPGGDEITNPDYKFYTGSLADFGGGFDDNGPDHSYFSDQLFAGTTAAPNFLTGTYDLYYDPAGPKVATLTITSDATPAAVPEPASWAMMIGGFGAIGAAMRRRRSVAIRA